MGGKCGKAEVDRLIESYRQAPQRLTPEEKKIVKGADKLCAYIKCLQELERGNREFSSARVYNEEALSAMDLPEVSYFLEHYIASFTKNIDEVTL